LQANKDSHADRIISKSNEAGRGLKDRAALLWGEYAFSAARLRIHFALDTARNSICATYPSDNSLPGVVLRFYNRTGNSLHEQNKHLGNCISGSLFSLHFLPPACHAILVQ
jgi:hypothetical protein